MLLRPEECCQASLWDPLQTLTLVYKCFIYNALLKILGSFCATPPVCRSAAMPLLFRRAAATLLRRFCQLLNYQYSAKSPPVVFARRRFRYRLIMRGLAKTGR